MHNADQGGAGSKERRIGRDLFPLDETGGLYPVARGQKVRQPGPATQSETGMAARDLVVDTRGPAPSRRATMLLSRLAIPIHWLSVLSVLLVLVIWGTLSALRLVSPDLVPGPLTVARTFVDILAHGYRGTTLLQDTVATLYRLGAAFVLASVVGIPLGLAMGYNGRIRAAFDYLIQFTRPLPPLSYYVLLIVWLGTGNSSKIALLYLTAFPILTIDSMAGVRATNIQKIQAAQALGASEWQVFRYVIFPSALPMIFTGMSIAMAVTFSTVVAAELLAATDGLGWMVFSAGKFLRNDVIIMAIIILGLLGVLLTRLIRIFDRRVIHWRGVE